MGAAVAAPAADGCGAAGQARPRLAWRGLAGPRLTRPRVAWAVGTASAGQFGCFPAGQFGCFPAGEFGCFPAGQARAGGLAPWQRRALAVRASARLTQRAGVRAWPGLRHLVRAVLTHRTDGSGIGGLRPIFCDVRTY
ncbi:MAG: hypothetical protein M0030_29605 [Actinomycetota bacterium]|nr:hypothetical protein [Actinomycetota bacterium]